MPIYYFFQKFEKYLIIYLGLDMATNEIMNCVFCKNKTSGAHSCGICLKPCHSLQMLVGINLLKAE
jgi:hypothetical protein